VQCKAARTLSAIWKSVASVSNTLSAKQCIRWSE